jgi:predicted glutamine amidotransferase
MEKRGTESWGYAYISALDSKLRMRKHLGKIVDAWSTEAAPPDDAHAIIYHTRAASMGAVTAANSHPFITKLKGKGILAGTHNGVITNHTELNEKNNTDFKVDSQHIWHYFANQLDTFEIEGWGSTVCIIQDPKHRTSTYMGFMKFNHDALYIYKLPGNDGIVYASTETAVKEAARFAYGKSASDIKRLKIEGDAFYATPLFIKSKQEQEVGRLYRMWKQIFGTRGAWRGRHVSNIPESAYPDEWSYSSSGYMGYNSPTTVPNSLLNTARHPHTGINKHKTCVCCNRTDTIDGTKEVICKHCIEFFNQEFQAHNISIATDTEVTNATT